MMRYAQIDEDGYVVSDSYLSGEVIAKDMIPIPEDFDITNKKYVNGEWVEYIPEPIPEPILSEVEQAILQSVVNSEYLIALQENRL